MTIDVRFISISGNTRAFIQKLVEFANKFNLVNLPIIKAPQYAGELIALEKVSEYRQSRASTVVPLSERLVYTLCRVSVALER